MHEPMTVPQTWETGTGIFRSALPDGFSAAQTRRTSSSLTCVRGFMAWITISSSSNSKSLLPSTSVRCALHVTARLMCEEERATCLVEQVGRAWYRVVWCASLKHGCNFFCQILC